MLSWALLNDEGFAQAAGPSGWFDGLNHERIVVDTPGLRVRRLSDGLRIGCWRRTSRSVRQDRCPPLLADGVCHGGLRRTSLGTDWTNL